MRKPLIVVSLFILIVLVQLIVTKPIRKSLRKQLNPNYASAIAAYRRLETQIPSKELQAITVIAILNGAQKSEEQMEKNLIKIIKELLESEATVELMDQKIVAIEKQLLRDEKAIEILTSAMDIAIHKKDINTYQNEMHTLLKNLKEQTNPENELNSIGEEGELLAAASVDVEDMSLRIGKLRKNIMQQVQRMKTNLEQKITTTLDYLIAEADDDGVLAKASNKTLRKRNILFNEAEIPADVRIIDSILNEADFHKNLIEDEFLQRADVKEHIDSDHDDDDDEFAFEVDKPKKVANTNTTTTTSTSTSTTTTTTTTTMASTTSTIPITSASTRTSVTTRNNTRNNAAIELTTLQPEHNQKQEEASAEDSMELLPAMEGTPATGLVGLITSLSGGEGGSDIGALVGALTGVVSNLFGPGGLDVETLISSASSLLAGLLSRGKNFGQVLGEYVGTFFDGVSGGGGAINNGQFFGNFLGTVYASLSADPEDDDEPARPLLFLQTLVNSFHEAKNRKSSEEEDSAERKDKGDHGHHPANGGGGGGGGGSDSAAFVKHITQHLVSSVVSLVLNAVVGASGGSSHASTGLFAHSSGHKGGGGGGDAAGALSHIKLG